MEDKLIEDFGRSTDKRGGKRKGAGRKPNAVKNERIVMNVPAKYIQEIRIKFDKIKKAYENRCQREL